ncbi:RHS repeat-associated core domain-containing protein [Kitasatospora sp. GP82]|uniref:RHS repeat-associated core domain-containing protein n=1 Tax=Kitasatospora sp. GP82 TaxID=3035089 RepID=UPI002476FBB3|nr:RHS repeat-associated core domain-containing protein [Kitasatospora sp. GP82]
MRYDAAARKVIVDVSLPGRPTSSRTSLQVPNAQQASGAMLLAQSAAPIGGGGDYRASSLNSSAGWAAGGSNGAFTYSYAITVPPALGGTTPGVSLGYDSSSVDGKTSATNTQASWIGDGWDYNPGFIERAYKPCNKAGIDNSGDLCWAGDNLTLSFGSRSGPLVRDDSSSAWRLQNDDGTKVEVKTGADNGAKNGEYIKLTDNSGDTYYFGANHLPAADGNSLTGTGATSNSVSTAPVYSANGGDPCYDSAQGKNSWCQMAQRWSLDYAVDAHGNLTTYTYTPETNWYSRGGGQNSGNGTLTAYTRANLLHQIAYGQRLSEQLGAAGGLKPAAQITFSTSERCLPDASFTCDPAQRTSANSYRWPDVPVDQECKNSDTCTNYSPTFFTTRRLTGILTQVRSNNTWQDVDSYTLTHTFPDPADGSSQRALWLDSIQRSGKATTTTPVTTSPITLPPVSFTPVMLPNRVDGVASSANGATFPDINRPRIQQVRSETGAVVNVDYNLPGCSRLKKVMPPGEDSNTMACFPVKWTPPGSLTDSDPILDWFNHYTVASLSTSDPATGATKLQTSYSYGPAAWHRDDHEYTDPKARTWDDFRGFATVTTTTGGSDSPKSQTRTTYLQGMDGDKTSGSPRSVTIPDALGESVTDDNWLAGQVLQTETFANAGDTTPVGVTVNRTTNPVTTATHAKTGTTTLDVPLIARYDGTTAISTTQALKTDQTKRTSSTTTTTDPAHNNRPLTSLVKADGLPDVCTRTGYATAPDPQRTNLVAETLVISGSSSCAAAPNSSNTVSGHRVLYDGLAFGQANSTSDATGTQVLSSFDGSGNAVYLSTAASTFDSYGRSLSVTDLTSTDAKHAKGQTTTTTTYTAAATGELPTSIKVSSPVPGATGTWDTTTTLDARRSLPLTVTDLNGKTGTESYDALGRLASVWLPGRTTAQKANKTFEYAIDSNRAAAPYVAAHTLTKDGSGIYTTSIQIMDALGRVRQSQTSPSTASYTGRLISDTFYDSHGRAYKTNSPWYNADAAPNGTLVVPATTPDAADNRIPSQTRLTFDGQGRTVSSTFVALGVDQWSTTTAYPGVDRTDVTPPTGSWPTTAVTDGAGRTAELWQYQTSTPTGRSSDATITHYSYTTDGKPLTRKDAAGNTWTYGYDQRGRQTTATDPDSGTTTQTWDDAGHLASTTDARNTALSYTYDLIGRKTGLYQGNVTPANQLAGWTYDTVAKGRPASSTRYVGGTSGSAYTATVAGYDNGYRATGSTVTIPGAEIGATTPFTYRTTSTYDQITGNLLLASLPANGGLPNESLAYTYGSYGLLSDYAGAVTYDLNTSYDAYGRPQRTTVNPYGSQVVTTTSYDQSTGQVLSQYVDKQTSTTGQTQITNYTYNPVGQITSISDTPDNTPSLTDRQCFTYDSLGRLATAWTDTGTITTPDPSQHKVLSQGSCTNSTPTSGATAPARTTVGGGNPYWQDYSYDLTGNRTRLIQHNTAGGTAKDISTTQTFGAPQAVNTPTTAPNTGGGTGGPHGLLASATTSATGTKSTAYQYDAVGNTTAVTDTSGTTTLTWNSEDKLASTATTGQSGSTTYLYDADGNQLIRRDPGKTTINLGADELTYDTTSKTLTGTRYYPMPNGMTTVRVGTNGLVTQIADHHGTAGLAIDLSTLTTSRRPTDPFGNPRSAQSSTWAGDHGFVGGTKDDVTGLTNLGAREYQPTTGRFLNPDPILDPASPQQWNGYAYSNSNPVDLADPSGLHFEECSNGMYKCQGGIDPIEKGDNYDNIVSQNMVKQQVEGESSGDWQRASRGHSRAYTEACGDGHCAVGYHGNEGNNADFLAGLGASLVAIDDAYERLLHWGDTSRPSSYPLQSYMGWVESKGVDPGTANFASGTFLPVAIGDAYAARPGRPEGGMPCNSFPAGTQVLLADGQAKPIDQMAVGDRVTATAPVDGKTASEPVVAVITTPADRDFTDLTVKAQADESGSPEAGNNSTETITATWHHPFWDETTGRWTDASDLHPGDHLRRTDGSAVVLVGIRNYHRDAVTFNLTVADLHTYYVLAGTTPVLVHNCPSGGGFLSKLFGKSGKSEPVTYEPNATVGDLRGIGHDNVDENGNWRSDPFKAGVARSLDDGQLVRSTTRPNTNDMDLLRYHAEDNYMIEGNHRMAELLSRAADPNNKNITYDTPIYIHLWPR